MTVVTTGGKYCDIDGYASIFVYRELQNILGKEVKAYILVPLNNSITPSVLKFKFDYEAVLIPDKDSDFVIMDVSEPLFIPKFASEDRIVGLFDHHFGFENYWKKRLGKRVKIEAVGACATLIWEEIVNKGVEAKISKESKLLIFTAIISNTLNLKSRVTTKRDLTALLEIKQNTLIPQGWEENYFNECTQELLDDIDKALTNDTKMVTFKGKTVCITQMEMWEGRDLIDGYRQEIDSFLKKQKADIKFLTIPSIKEGVNYFIANDDESRQFISSLDQVVWSDGLGVLSELILRKELLKKMLTI